MKYDYLIVGAGLFGAVFARQMAEVGKKVLIIDKRSHIGGNAYTELSNETHIHVYGPHLFHTNNNDIWSYVNRFSEFNHYRHKVKSNYNGKIYSMPFNMMTFHQFWGCVTPKEAKECLDQKRIKIANPKNLEEQAIAIVGEEIYDTLIYGYTKKQWRRDPKDLPASIIKRIPLRFTYDDNYFNDRFQGVPVNGYSGMIANIIDEIDVKLKTNFHEDIKNWRSIARKLVYSGAIDELYKYKYGELEYLTLELNTKYYDIDDYQGIGQMNYTSVHIPYTRIVEHKHFYSNQQTKGTLVTKEYPIDWERGKIPFYPINNEDNNRKYQLYYQESKKYSDIIIGGRLGKYQYMDMHQVIAQAITASKKEMKKFNLKPFANTIREKT